MAILHYLGSDNKYHALPVGETITATEPESYSTEEQVIGQWIDGKPLYRKTFIIGPPSNGNWNILDSNTIFETANLVKATGKRSIDGPINLLRDLPYFNTTNDYCGLDVGAFNNQLEIFTRVPSGNIDDLTVTVEYTKTTDDPNSFSIDMLTTMDLDSKATAAEVAFCV